MSDPLNPPVVTENLSAHEIAQREVKAAHTEWCSLDHALVVTLLRLIEARFSDALAQERLAGWSAARERDTARARVEELEALYAHTLVDLDGMRKQRDDQVRRKRTAVATTKARAWDLLVGYHEQIRAQGKRIEELKVVSHMVDREARHQRNITKPIDAPPACVGCGGPHPFDTTLPSPTWNRVIRAAGLPDYLCTTCIVRAFVLAGEGFTAELWGEAFTGTPIEVRVGSAEESGARGA